MFGLNPHKSAVAGQFKGIKNPYGILSHWQFENWNGYKLKKDFQSLLIIYGLEVLSVALLVLLIAQQGTDLIYFRFRWQ